MNIRRHIFAVAATAMLSAGAYAEPISNSVYPDHLLVVYPQ